MPRNLRFVLTFPGGIVPGRRAHPSSLSMKSLLCFAWPVIGRAGAGALAALVLIVAGLPATRAEDAPQSWPLQRTPGPGGDPHQDPATWPRSPSPAQQPVRRAVAPQPALVDAGQGDWILAGGWKLASSIKVPATAREISQAGFDASTWYEATVPGTVLTTLVDQGVYPEPTYGLNNLAIPESLNREDYWYRHEFVPPADSTGRILTLTFKGINYTAEVWLNGCRLGDIRGAFQRGLFDITAQVRSGQANALAVRVSPVPHPGIPHEESLAAGAGPNGGAMTLDGPTFFCTEGWDWIPGIRDRCTGLWQDVVLHVSGPVTLGDVHVKTDLPLPDTSRAEVFVSAAIANHAAEPQTFTVRGDFEGAAFSQTLTLAPHAQGFAKFGAGEFADLRVNHPRLWWPNGYGKPELYHLRLTVANAAGRVTETKSLRFGIRHLTYELSAFDPHGEVRRYEFSPSTVWSQLVVDKRHAALRASGSLFLPSIATGAEHSAGLTPSDDTATAPFLVIKVNGQRVVCKGGNWGLDEALKRVSRAKLEPYFRLERDLGLTMVRNWCGQNTEEVFYDLCDEYGLMVWNDFWVSSQDWNMQPLDLRLWLANAEDVIKRFRNHPSIVLWCGRNEGVPPPALNEGLDALVREHDSSRYYQPSSVAVNLLWSGPWNHADPVKFFSEYGRGFTTELGLPCPPTADAIRAMMPAADQWPISDTWAYHDWHQKDHGEVPAFMDAIAKQFGPATDLEDFCRKAQMLNYAGHRALFEGLNAHLWNPAPGRLIWMSHSTWPSMEWQLYSSDYETNGAYFGARKACEPLHVQCNLDDRKVVVTNTTLAAVPDATVRAELFDLQGRRIAGQQSTVLAAANATTEAFRLDESAAASLPLYFVRLALVDAGGRTLSDNFYWHARREEDHRLLNTLPRVTLTGAATVKRGEEASVVTVELTNPATSVALLVKTTLRTATGERVLPVYASDGYFSLLPGESRRVILETPVTATPLQVAVDGWNAAPTALPVQE
jgi:beta-galactosidase/beta-glucuronidase